MMTLAEVNALPPAEFVVRLGAIFEHSPWVAERAAAKRPFVSRQHLLDTMCAVVDAAAQDEQLRLIRAHPQLRRSAREPLTVASSREQRGAGLDACAVEEATRLDALNVEYSAKFSMPFILAVRGHTPQSIIAVCERRLHNDPVSEHRAAIREIGVIAGYRLSELVSDTVAVGGL